MIVEQIQKSLVEVYDAWKSGLQFSDQEAAHLSPPLLLSVTDEYCNAERRILLFGQETLAGDGIAASRQNIQITLRTGSFLRWSRWPSFCRTPTVLKICAGLIRLSASRNIKRITTNHHFGGLFVRFKRGRVPE